MGPPHAGTESPIRHWKFWENHQCVRRLRPTRTYWAMRVVMSSVPQPFLTRAEPLLKTDPFTTSVITTVTTRIASGAVPNNDENLWHTIEGEHGQVIGV